MGLKDDLAAAAASADKALGRGCSICTLVLASEDEEERELLGGRRIGSRRLAVILQANGYDIGRSQIERHRGEGHQPA